MSENNTVQYTEDNIKTLEPREHVRLRPGMYIGKLGDGSSVDDGIYILLKEVIDNSIDEFRMKHGKKIEVKIKDGKVTIRDYGRGIPLGKIVEVVSIMNTGGKYDDGAFKKSIGLNGVGTKAVNFLSEYFQVKSVRDGKMRRAEFREGKLSEVHDEVDTSERNGTEITFIPDDSIFVNYKFRAEYVERMLRNYTYLNLGLKVYFNGEVFESQNGLKDLLEEEIDGDIVYPIIHIKDEDMEVALTHSDRSQSETYFSFVNGQYTSQGGTHLNAFKEAYVKTIREFYGKTFEAADIRKAIIGAVYINVGNPVFESQTKTKLGSTTMGQDKNGNELETIKTFMINYMKSKLDNYLHQHPEVAEALQKKILISERERKELSGIQKLARERAKKVSLHNKKLRDCRQHYNDQKAERKAESQIFITEGDSASGSITKSRDVETQAVFSLRGKPLNSYGLTKRVVYENEEFNLLQAALNIEDSLEDLRYNQVIIATDADVDGMHIRLLMITFFLQFFPDLIKNGHLYILQTPLFRVRNKKETRYCYSDAERIKALNELGKNPEITRFKGLGEISPDEFKHFIGKDIRLEPVVLGKDQTIDQLLEFYMGKNTPDRQSFILSNLVVEDPDINKKEALEDVEV
ncbi:DNA topoisomerase IV subunit B [Chryseobacterium sp. MFBS3-17]|uniref:DNA topoisomerase IV subunit B n=1 Tax=Chryseobacterium sp. MFBS3-17 TaxID=2886689 RepID=UPI001D0EAA55|nr:DNA topoisomerase IV subunit B [Chryseobacterium sp. MFBS3-17]MCC2590254.1 type IIA DNA topoisomerase subunit B [Chryseobacterium sp. MFBS3-17]